jgi:hypothetical protein
MDRHETWAMSLVLNWEGQEGTCRAPNSPVWRPAAPALQGLRAPVALALPDPLSKALGGRLIGWAAGGRDFGTGQASGWRGLGSNGRCQFWDW